jgi:ankyrin repeat protein
MAKDELGRSALHHACEYEGKETAALKYLLCDLELEVDYCDKFGHFYSLCLVWAFCIALGRTPFHLASRSGNVDILKILYNRKPDVAMAKDELGRSALHHACEYEGKETAALKYLLCDLELEVDYCDKFGRTPFHLASRSGNVDILKILYNRKPDVAMAKDEVDLSSVFLCPAISILCV